MSTKYRVRPGYWFKFHLQEKTWWGWKTIYRTDMEQNLIHVLQVCRITLDNPIKS